MVDVCEGIRQQPTGFASSYIGKSPRGGKPTTLQYSPELPVRLLMQVRLPASVRRLELLEVVGLGLGR